MNCTNASDSRLIHTNYHFIQLHRISNFNYEYNFRIQGQANISNERNLDKGDTLISGNEVSTRSHEMFTMTIDRFVFVSSLHTKKPYHEKQKRNSSETWRVKSNLVLMMKQKIIPLVVSEKKGRENNSVL